MPYRHFYLVNTVAFLLIAFFVLAGLCFIPYPGTQNDEVLFGAAIFDTRATSFWISVFKKPVPMMLMSYLGALKAWIYAPVFAIWKPSAYSLRVPVLLIGAFTIWLFFRLLLRVHGPRAALIGAALLATDTIYLLTTCFDWGPVVLQHALAVGAVLLLVRFHQTHSRVSLGAAFFLLGLALWDKALIGWSLIGMSLGLLCAFPRAVRQALSWRNVVLAAVCFCAGAFPLIRHNVRYPLQTLRTNVGWSAQDLAVKVEELRRSLDGCGLLGYLTYDDPADRTRQPRTSLERLSVSVDELAGKPRRGFMPYAVVAALLIIPFLWRTRARRPMLFAAICMAIVWGQMLFGRDVGASVHHAVLIWPWPQFLVAVGFAECSRRLRRAGIIALVLVVTTISARNVLVTNTNLSQFIRNGGSLSWTDAMYTLSDYAPTLSAERIVIFDWGILEPLRVLQQGRLPLVWGTDVLRRNPPTEADLQDFRGLIRSPGSVFISNTDAHEIFAGVNARLRQMLEAEGYRKELLRVVPDSNGRPAYEVFRILAK